MVPSDLVAAVDEAIPDLHGPTRRRISAETLAPLLDIFASIAEEHFALLSRADRRALRKAAVTIEVAVRRFHNTEGMEMRHAGAPSVNDGEVQVLRDIVAKCDDDAPSVADSALAFLATSGPVGTPGAAGDPDLAPVLRSDMATARRTLANREFKAACVMSGSVIEALLLWALKRKTAAELEAARAAWAADGAAKSKAPKMLSADWNAWKLHQLVEVSRRIVPVAVLTSGTADAASLARDFRNLIHPERADRTPPTAGKAEVGVGAMGLVIEELEALVRAGKL